ncbi:MAG: flagellar biosynthesis protein FlhB [Spirochaetae bacterium HGW-Spirochaetae-3]|nr:MAG: flagellar biosynthesis protein FlhB [Spirochaetae bacterium HGW-Spirochaetae-3]
MIAATLRVDPSAVSDISRIHLQWFAPEDEGKTEDPTEYRLKKEREEGRVPKSPDLVAAIGLLLSAITLAIIGPWMFSMLREMTIWFLTVSIEIDPTTDAGPVVRAFYYNFSRIVLPIAVVSMIAGVFSNVMQTGFMFTTKPLKPDFKKIAPKFGQYFKRTLFSGEALFNLAKSLFKVGVIGIVSYLNIRAEMPKLTRLYTSTVWNSVSFIAGIVIRIIIEAAILMLALAVPDYIFQKHQFKKRLKMSKQEVKEERKMFEGDPMIKGRLKDRMRDIMSRNMAVNVPKADVIVTNPTHFAIAIEFDPMTMAVPTVTAKGADEMAFRIRSLAKEAGVPIMENRPLARALYADADVGDPVPEAYYEAISRILAHVAKIDKRVAAKYASMGV